MLSSYLNVYNTCLVILDRRGYKISYEQPKGAWHAEKSGFKFLADNPIELLGLSAIFEEIAPTSDSEYWWKIDGPNLLARWDPEF